MEDFWDSNGPFALVKLADRMVPVPRDNKAEVSLYSLCRAWVRNNTSLPLSTEAQLSHQADVAARPGGTAGTTTNGDAPQAGIQSVQTPSQQDSQQQQAQVAPSESQTNGLVSILPPVLPPTPLETETTPPTYPLDDFEAQEPEEALRKFKQHWTAVRQYHQAVRAAKLSRHRERLVALLGEPSMLPPQVLQMQAAGLLVSPQQFLQQQQLQQLHQAGVLGLPAQVLLDQMQSGGVTGLNPMHGAGLIVGPGMGPEGNLTTGLPCGPIPGLCSLGVSQPVTRVVAGGTEVNNVADAQAALATIMNLGPPLTPGAADTLVVGQQQQQQPGLLGTGASADALEQVTLPPYDFVVSLQQQHLQQHISEQPRGPQPVSAAASGSGQQPVLGELSAAVAAAAEAGNVQEKAKEQQLTPLEIDTVDSGNVARASEAHELTREGWVEDEEAHLVGPGPEGSKNMDIDSRSPPGTYSGRLNNPDC